MSVIDQFDKNFTSRQASYKMVAVLAVLKAMSEAGEADVGDVVRNFKQFYMQRQEYGKLPEQKKIKLTRVSSLSDSEIRDTLLNNPVNYLSGLLFYDSEKEKLVLTDKVKEQLDKRTVEAIRNLAYEHLYRYYKGFDSQHLKLQELDDLPLGSAVTATDVANLSGQNQMKGIHPIFKENYKAVAILCTIQGEEYSNQWLGSDKSILKYYLEGRKGKDGSKIYNLKQKSNASIINSKKEGYPLHIFVREKKGELFHYGGQFLFEEVKQENSGDYFSILKRKEAENMDIPAVARREIMLHKDTNLDKKENYGAVLNRVCDYIGGKGFVFEKSLIKNFYLSLKTKPFAILAGISGTGKSKLVELFAEAVGATNENHRFELIPVRPDWNDNADILGYKNLEGWFQPGPLTKVIQRAIKDKDKPYFVCLDEMNLARVEYYLSDFLSLLETRKFTSGELRSNRLFRETDFMKEEDRKEFSDLYIPGNLYIIGTVNMDETTHPFSKKVLDRANTIEFTDVQLDNFMGDADQERISVDISNEFIKGNYCVLKDCLAEHQEIVEEFIADLIEVNKVLQRANLHVGYRVRDELSFYMVYNEQFGLMNRNEAFDWQLLQKILPRIQGSARQAYKVLRVQFLFMYQ